MSVAYYTLEQGAATDAIQRAVAQMIAQPPAFDRFVTHVDRIGFDWNQARECHHSNMSIVAVIGGMIDDVAAKEALSPSCRLADAVGKVSSLDENQSRVFLAAADYCGQASNARRFTEAVNTLIDTEGLGEYLERDWAGGIKHEHIRPLGHGASLKDENAPNPMERVKSKAQSDRLPKDQRIPLIIVLALYNESAARDTFKGSGWAFHGVELGRWLRERFESNERSARAALLALGHYCYW